VTSITDFFPSIVEPESERLSPPSTAWRGWWICAKDPRRSRDIASGSPDAVKQWIEGSPTMEPDAMIMHNALRTPRAAAVAGVVFAVLLATILVLLRLAARSQLVGSHAWLTDTGVAWAPRLVPFAGIAFLWLIGVVRDRIGESEDRFFATVFLGSGLLFTALLFVASAITEAVLTESATALTQTSMATCEFGLKIASLLLNSYAMRMAAVFMVSTATIGLRTHFIPRWLAISGITIAVILLLGIEVTRWVALLFPLWILMFSLDTLVFSFNRDRAAEAPEI
jgi:hypothetical protein